MLKLKPNPDSPAPGLEWATDAALEREYPAGSEEQKRAALLKGLRTILDTLGYDNEKHWASLCGTYDDYVIVEIYGNGEHDYWRIEYEMAETDSEFTFTFKNPRRQAKQVSFIDAGEPASSSTAATVTKEGDESEQPGAAPKTEGEPGAKESEPEEPAATDPKLVIEDQRTNEGEHRFFSKAYLSEGQADARAKFEKTGEVPGKVRGRVPMLRVGVTTANRNNYTVECAKRLWKDLTAMLESTDHQHNGPWPDGVMYVLHETALEEHANKITEAAGKITGLYIEGGKSIDQITDGDVIGVKFETLSTTAGRDLAAILLETNYIGGISLRGFKEEGKVESDGVDYVSKLDPVGFGADFVRRGAARFESPAAAAVVLEGERETGSMDLEKLKKESPDLYKQIMEARQIKFESGVDNVVAALKPKVDALEGLTDKAKEALLAEMRPTVLAEAEKLREASPDLDPTTESFRDQVLSKVDPLFAQKRDSMQAIMAEGVRGFMKAHNIPEDAVAGGLPGMGGKEQKLEAVPFISTLDGEELVVESMNEEVGLPRGQKTPDGRPVGPRLTDVVVSRFLGRPVFMESPNGGGIAHVLDIEHPRLRSKIGQVSAVYEKEPFFVDASGRGVNDRELRKMESFKQINRAIRGLVKMEANEITSSDLPTLHPAVRQGVLEVLFPMSVWANISTLWPVNSPSYEIDYYDYRRRGEHEFGTLAYGGSFGGTDEGALSIPERLYIKVSVAIAGTAVFTITYTNAAGVSKQVTRTITAAEGTASSYHLVYPEPGDQILDVTAVTVTGWTAGTVVLVAEDPINTGTELAVSQRAAMSLQTLTGTVEELDVDGEISWRAMEDANRSLLATGPGRVDLAADFLNTVLKDFMKFIDVRGIVYLNNASNFLSVNTTLFDERSVPSGYTRPTWREELLNYLIRHKSMLADRGNVTPTWALVNMGADENKYTWFSNRVSGNQGPRQESFLSAGGWGRIHNVEFLGAQMQTRGQVMMGSRETVFYPVYLPMQIRGPLYNGQKADQYIIRQRSKQIAVRPETRGYLQIQE